MEERGRKSLIILVGKNFCGELRMYFYIGKESDLHIVPRVHKQAGLKIHTIDSVDT